MSSTTVLQAIGARNTYLSGLTPGGTGPAKEISQRSALIPIDGSGWLKFSKSWETLGHGSTSSLENDDYRLGVYGIRQKGPQELFAYLAFGQQNNDGKRVIAGAQANSDYHSRTIELGAQYSYDLDEGKSGWHKKPYIEAQAVRYNQDSYTESAAGIYNQRVGSAGVTYSAATLGLAMERRTAADEVALRLGYKHVFGGNDLACPVSLAAGGPAFTVHGSNLDRNLLVLGLHAEQAQEDGWSLAGDVQLEQGSSQRSIQASVQVKKSW